MPLTECPNCGEVISDMAEKCPHCGFEVANYWKWEKMQKTTSEEIESDTKTMGDSVPGEEEEVSIEDTETVDKNDHESDTEETIGSDIYNKTYTTNTNNAASSYKKEYIKPLKNGLIIVIFVFAIFAAVFFYRGYDVKNNYYHIGTSSTVWDQNAYVGGDAYNMIINGTYFTGYMVVGTGCMICAIISGLGLIIVAAKERDQELLEQIENNCE